MDDEARRRPVLRARPDAFAKRNTLEVRIQPAAPADLHQPTAARPAAESLKPSLTRQAPTKELRTTRFVDAAESLARRCAGAASFAAAQSARAIRRAAGACSRAMSSAASRAGAVPAFTARASASAVSAMKRQGRREPSPLDLLAAEARHSALANRLRNFGRLSDAEERLVFELDRSDRQTHQAGADIASAGEPARPLVIVSGWAARVRLAHNGRLQILGFLLPGDSIGLEGAGRQLCPVTIQALTTVETADASRLASAAANPARFPALADALTQCAAQEACFADSQIMRLGAMSRADRLANLLLELRWRLMEAKLADEFQFPMPLTEETLAAALGLRRHEMGKTKAALRARRVISVVYGRATAHPAARRMGFAGFQPPSACACARIAPAEPEIEAAPRQPLMLVTAD
jgi:CRP-like cAMP-binding protein